MSKLFDPNAQRSKWAPDPIPCEDCGTLLDNDWYKSGPQARVCRSCQNKRYEAKTRGTPEGERRRKRKTLLAKLKRIEDRMIRDQLTHAEVCEDLKALNNS
jgi:hypothetical protein